MAMGCQAKGQTTMLRLKLWPTWTKLAATKSMASKETKRECPLGTGNERRNQFFLFALKPQRDDIFLKYERMKNIERLWKHSVCKHVLAFLPPFCCFLSNNFSFFLPLCFNWYQSQVEDSVSAQSPKTNLPTSPTLHACGIPNSSKSFLSLSWYEPCTVKPLQWFEKEGGRSKWLGEIHGRTLELCDISPCTFRLLQYGQVNLHAWKVHVLLFSHGDVIHDLTTYPFGWYLLLESTNTADCTSKKTRPLLSQNHLHSS